MEAVRLLWTCRIQGGSQTCSANMSLPYAVTQSSSALPLCSAHIKQQRVTHTRNPPPLLRSAYIIKQVANPIWFLTLRPATALLSSKHQLLQFVIQTAFLSILTPPPNNISFCHGKQHIIWRMCQLCMMHLSLTFICQYILHEFLSIAPKYI